MTVAQLIRNYARQYGVDPRAALAVATTEGGLRWGAVGDQGTSYGPFQLHRGGALPRGRNAAWANSPAGLEYAIRQMARAGARGKQGQAAINAIVRQFERPANPGAQVAKAWSRYGSQNIGGGAGPAPNPPSPGQVKSPAPDPRELGMALISQVGRRPDVSSLLPLLQQRAQQEVEPRVAGAAKVLRAAGKPVTPESLFQLVNRLDQTVTSGLRPGAHTARGGQSYHSRKDPSGRSRAFDLDPSDPDARKLIAHARANPGYYREFFYSKLGWFIKNGKRYPISQLNKTDRDNHYDHIHAAR